RDTEDRIVEVRDPLGFDSSGTYVGPAAVIYEYAPDTGNLLTVARLTDRSAYEGVGKYDVITYQYTNSAYPHYLTGIKDPNGQRVQRQGICDRYHQGRLNEPDDVQQFWAGNGKYRRTVQSHC